MLDGKLLETRVNSRAIGAELLIYGSCIPNEYPELLKEFSDTPRLHTCLEESHLDQVAWKIQSIVHERKVKKISVLTIDGSPHCIQLHYALEDLKKLFPELMVSHQVIEKGELIEINGESVRRSRHLSELEVR